MLRKSLLDWFIHLKAIHDAEAVLELARKKAEASKEALAQVNDINLVIFSCSNPRDLVNYAQLAYQCSKLKFFQSHLLAT